MYRAAAASHDAVESHVMIVRGPFFQPGYGLPVYRTMRPKHPLFVFLRLLQRAHSTR